MATHDLAFIRCRSTAAGNFAHVCSGYRMSFEHFVIVRNNPFHLLQIFTLHEEGWKDH